MVRATGEEIEGVWKQGQDGIERGEGAGWAAGEIEDQRTCEGAADPSAEGGEGRLQEADGAHPLGEAVSEALAYQPRGFRGDIAGSEAGSACGDDQSRPGGVVAEGCGDQVYLVGHGLERDLGGAGGLEACCNSRPGEVFLPAMEAAIADGNDGYAGAGGKGRVHPSSLRPEARPARRLTARGQVPDYQVPA